MSYIIEHSEEYRNPFLCYCTLLEFMKESGEDYIDCNHSIVNAYTFSMWLLGKKYITSEDVERLFEIKDLTLQEVLCGEVLFPKSYGCDGLAQMKAYSILAEYMSSIKEFRQRLYDSVNNKATAFVNREFYKDEKGVSLACIISSTDLEDDVHEIGTVDVWSLTYKEQWNLVRKISISEADEGSYIIDNE